MKEPEKLIRKYYADNNITYGAPLLFSYVKKSKTGGDWAIIEYYAAKYGHVRGKKEKDVVTKLVMRFNPDTYRYSMSNSVIRYQSYSSLAIDHLLFDFHKEMSGCPNYYHKTGKETGENRLYQHVKWKGEIMPTSEIPLNDFSGTKYQYCKYAFKDKSIATGIHSYSYWSKNWYGNLPDYLRKFNLNPKAMEMFASMGLAKYMREDFLIRLRDDKPFASWYRKHAKMMIHESIYKIENTARREIGRTNFEICRNEERRLNKLSEKRTWTRKMKKMERDEMLRKQEAERLEREERQNRAKRICDLYNKLKSICRTYGAYEVIVPKTERDMVKEGKRMHNCVGQCYPSQQGVNAIVLFFHKNGKPCVDVEVDIKTFEVVQCRAVCNKDAKEDAHRLAKRIAASIEKIYKEAA